MNTSAAVQLETAEAVDRLLRELLDADPRLLSEQQQLQMARLNDKLTARLHALSTRTLAGIDKGQVTKQLHGVSTTSWLRECRGYSGAQASGVVKEALRTVNAPLVWHALAEATMSPRQAAVIVEALRKLPPDLAPDQERAAEQTMVEAADRWDPQELGVIGERLYQVIDPEHADAVLGQKLEQQEKAARRNRELRLSNDRMGSVHLKGRLPAAEGEKLAAVLDSLVDRKCEQDPEPPPCGSSCAGASCGLCGGKESRARRRADALVELAQAYGDTHHAPSGGSDRARVNVTVDLDKLLSGIGWADTTCGPMSAQQLRLLACDGEIIPMVLNSLGVPLDVGQPHRFFEGTLRAALVARDGGCVFPGCTAPARRCDAHHIDPWWRGGPTRLDNGVLLCPHHHALVEPSRQRFFDPNRWQVRLNPTDRLPEFLPPQALDRQRRVRRHLRHRLRTTPPGNSDADP